MVLNDSAYSKCTIACAYYKPQPKKLEAEKCKEQQQRQQQQQQEQQQQQQRSDS